MDEIDHIQIRDSVFQQIILTHRKRIPESRNGRCLWCDEYPVSGYSQAFCCRECGEDYAKAERNEKMKSS
ncbi:hypothetical protein AB7W40_13795 [Providencia rettgeri]